MFSNNDITWYPIFGTWREYIFNQIQISFNCMVHSHSFCRCRGRLQWYTYSGEVNTNANRGPNVVQPDTTCWSFEATVSLNRRKHSVPSAWLWSLHLGSSCYQHLVTYSQERKYKEQKHYFSIPVSILNSVWGSLCILSLVNHWHSCKLLDQTPIVQHDYKHCTVTIRTYATLINLL